MHNYIKYLLSKCKQQSNANAEKTVLYKTASFQAAGPQPAQRPGRSDRRTAGGGILCRHAHSLLSMPLTSGVCVAMPAFKLQENILNIHCDINQSKRLN